MINPSRDEIANRAEESVRAPGGFAELNTRAALQRALVFSSARLLQDLVGRVAMFWFIIAAENSGRHVAGACLVFIFCAMWYISRERLRDAVTQIEFGFVVGAQKGRDTFPTARWDYFLGVLGSRATSRRDIAFFETMLRLEPIAWGVVGVILTLAR